MKILALHSDFITVEPKAKAIKDAENIEKAKLEMKECLVVFSAVEKRDEDNPGNVTKRLVKEITDILGQVKAKKVMLYPYVHLTSNPSSPSTALKVLKDAEQILLKDKLGVMRAPFGWYKAFTISCKGHPLSELSREFGPEDAKEEKKHDKGSDKAFELSKHALSEAEKLNLSTAATIAKSIKDLYPDSQIGSMGLYNDQAYVDVANVKLNEDDFAKIKKQAKKNIGKIIKFEKSSAKELTEDYQKDILKDLGSGADVYKLDNVHFVPLFKDPFMRSTRDLVEISILKLLGSAYWKNNSSNQQLVRLYCVGFSDKAKYEDYVKRTEDAMARDHNKLGRELGMFMTSDLVGQGLPLLSPKGAKMFQILQRFIEDEEEKRGYLLTKTPYMAKSDLYKVSGHWDHYREGMFIVNGSGDEMALRPMTCPFQFQIYKSRIQSYRDLPIRYNETSTLFRNEDSGEMHGLIRMRQFTLSEGHLICRMDQLEEEFLGVIDLINYVMKSLGLSGCTYRFSKWDPNNKSKYIDNPPAWEESQKILKRILDKIGLDYEEKDGEAAFYGPKLDIQMKNVFGKEDTIITVQIDFALPERFDMTYVNAEGKEERPIIIHRSSIGCYERTMALLIEQYAGKFPLWMNPLQVKVLTINDNCIPFAKDLVAKMKAKGLRVELDDRQRTMGKKVLDAQQEKVNYIITVGEKEVEKNVLAVRTRDGKVKFGVKADEFMAELLKEVEKKDIK
ncbi:MAG: threonine--tRNA ligase [Candidatus Woesearchaeota archaeon]